MHDILGQIAHRPWPLPSAPWIMHQRWVNLLFAHWRVPMARLRPLVPSAMAVEEFDGTAWVGLAPFRLTRLHARFLPPLPFASEFLEMNLRTYVRVGNKPGIFFFTLEAESRLAVAAARLTYRLPYRLARMQMRCTDGWIHYHSRRVRTPHAEFVGEYRGTGAARSPEPGTLEHFLTERYALYAMLGSRRVLRGEIHHAPWQLQRAEAHMRRNTVAAAHGIGLPDELPLLHFSARQDTLVWAPTIAG
jgi:uncharacterized protein YqjF (DUF2071 family)